MTNKEYVIKYINEHDEVLEDIMTDTCYLCRQVGCSDYCNKTLYKSCTQTIHEWLKQHRDLPFKFGDIVEVKMGLGSTELRYYVGNELDVLYFAKTKEYVDLIKAKGLGAVRKQDLLLMYASSIDSLIKKVGDSNA